MKRKFIHSVLLVLFCCSCSSYRKIPYFHDLDKTSITTAPIENYSPLTIQPNDVLAINVSSLNQEASAIFTSNLNRVNGNNYDNSPENPVVGYLVDQNGEIQVPLIGAIIVAGSTTKELQHALGKLLLDYLNEPQVNIRIINFKISVMGDVLRPGVFNIQNEQVSITEALSLAGDLQITAIRQVLLVRELEGTRQFIPIDLTSKEIFDSPYYYLKNHDMIYVQPDKTKFATVDRSYRTTSILLSSLSIVAIVFSTLYR